MRLGAWLRSGEGIGWLAAGTIPNSPYYRVPVLYLLLECALWYCSMLLLELCRCSADIFLPSRPRTGLTTTYITVYGRGPIG